MAKKCLYITLISVSAIFLTLSVGALILFSNIDYLINQQIKEKAPLVDGSEPFENWSKPKEDTTFLFTIYLFHVVNPDGYQKGELPIVKEFGPYDFKQKKIFDIIGWDANEHRLTYRMKRVFYRDESCRGNLSDKVTVLNVPLISLANILNIKLEKLSPFFRIPAQVFASRIFKSYDPFVTQKVGDLLFDGYKDQFTTRVSVLIEDILKRFNFKLDGPQSINATGYFSLLGQKNNSDYGLMTIDTGKEDLGELGKLVYLDGKNKVGCWSGDCSSLHGTDGLIHHPFINDNDVLSVFEPELNRTVFLNYEKDTEYQGIPTKRFLLSESTYNAPEHNAYNQCFCPNKDKINKRDGILRSGHCNFDVPMVFSNPHFYQGDKYFRDRIKGFKPNKERHESYADIPKELGMVINGRKTVQLNIDNKAYADIVTTTKYHKQVPREIFPVFWLQDSGAAGPTSISQLKEELYDKVSNIKKYLIIFTAVFIAGFLVPLIYLVIDVYLRWRKPEDDRQHIITSHDSFSNLNSSPFTSTDRNASEDTTNGPKVEIEEECHDSAVEV